MVTNILLAVIAVWLLAELITYVVGARAYGFGWPIRAFRSAWRRAFAPKPTYTEMVLFIEGETCPCEECQGQVYH